MAPLILISTVITHWFGGSAGREGTAVQMGGSIASSFGRCFRLNASQTRILLMAGIAAGFGGVFGTPIAGAVFALEVLMVGRIQYHALIPCLIASVIGDWSCRYWGCEHTHYAINSMNGTRFHFHLWIWVKVALVGILSGLAAVLFAETMHLCGAGIKKAVPYAPFRPFLGGILLIALVHLLGTREYLGLGVWSPHAEDMTITRFFHQDHVHPWAWALKILFTVLTLSCGFKGGEVTPLFFIGAALGGALSSPLNAPSDLLAAVGFVAIFAGASNTPLASTIMGMELFGTSHGVYLATGCFLAYLVSGRSGIYLSQRVAVPENRSPNHPHGISLREARRMKSTAAHRAFRHLHRRLSPTRKCSSKPAHPPSSVLLEESSPQSVGNIHQSNESGHLDQRKDGAQHIDRQSHNRIPLVGEHDDDGEPQRDQDQR